MILINDIGFNWHENSPWLKSIWSSAIQTVLIHVHHLHTFMINNKRKQQIRNGITIQTTLFFIWTTGNNFIDILFDFPRWIQVVYPCSHFSLVLKTLWELYCLIYLSISFNLIVFIKVFGKQRYFLCVCSTLIPSYITFYPVSLYSNLDNNLFYISTAMMVKMLN